MRTASERDILYLEAAVESDPTFGAVHLMSDLMSRLENRYKDKVTQRLTGLGTRKIFIKQMRIDSVNQIAWLLVQSNYKHGPDASFADFETDEQRDEPKKPGEGRPETSHIAISLIPSTKSKAYLVLMEECQALPRARLEQYLNSQLRRMSYQPSRWETPHPDGSMVRGKPRVTHYQNKIALRGFVSDDFQHDLDAGKLAGISLETGAVAIAGFGDGSGIEPVRKVLRMGAKTPWARNPVEKVRAALRLGRAEKYEVARIHFQTNQKVGRTALLDVATGTVVGDSYIKRGRMRNGATNWGEAEHDFSALAIDLMTKMVQEQR